MTSDYVVVPREMLPEMSEAAAKALNKAMAGDEAGWAYMQAEAEAAYAGALSAAPSPWKEISEADQVKHDETPVLLWNEETGMLPVVAEWSPNLRMWWTESGTMIGVDYPTHFCLLPSLPAPPSNPT